MKKKKEIRSRITSIIFMLVLLVVSTLYVYYPNKQNLVSSLTFLHQNESLYIEELSEGIKLAEAYPITDQEGIESIPYQFKLVNTTNKAITYQLSFKNQIDTIKSNNATPLDHKYLRYSITDNDNSIINTLPDNEIIYQATIPANSEIMLEFRTWLGDNFDSDAMGKTYIGKMEVNQVESSI